MNRSVLFLRSQYNFLDGHVDHVQSLRKWAITVILSAHLAVLLAAVEWALGQVFGYTVDVFVMSMYLGICVSRFDE